MKIATWNVNSVRARLDRVVEWMQSATPDVALLQETKVVDDKFPREPFEALGYQLALHGQPSLNGVAILSKLPMADVRCGLEGDPGDQQARYIEATIEGMRLASVYVPNGTEVGSDKFAFKMAFFKRLTSRCRELLAERQSFIIGGDYNVAPEPIDVYDVADVAGDICYHPDEHKALRALVNLGLYDAFRVAHPNRRQFTWWHYQGRAFELDHGMRIDHLLCSPQAIDQLQSCDVDAAPRSGKGTSDHVPVWCDVSAPS